MQPIRHLTIDLDDTLWDCGAVIQRAERCVHQWLQQHYPRITQRYSMEAMRDRRLLLAAQQPHLKNDLSRLRRESLALHAREAGYTEALVEPAFNVFLEARNQVSCFPDVEPALERLRSRYIVTALTNGNADVHRVGLGHYFHFSVSSACAGAAKPDPRIFHHACETAGVAAEYTVHVGDSPEHDIGGAQAAGIRCVWVNRNGREWPLGPVPDAEIADLYQLVQLLASWQEPAAAGRDARDMP